MNSVKFTLSCREFPQTSSKSNKCSVTQSKMCRQIIGHHTLYNEAHEFMVIECMKRAAEKEKWLEKQGFWSKLFRSMPSCKVTLRRKGRNS
jgi:hypothetical protein